MARLFTPRWAGHGASLLAVLKDTRRGQARARGSDARACGRSSLPGGIINGSRLSMRWVRETPHGERGRRIGHLLDRGAEGGRRRGRRAALAALFRDARAPGARRAPRLAPEGGGRG